MGLKSLLAAGLTALLLGPAANAQTSPAPRLPLPEAADGEHPAFLAAYYAPALKIGAARPRLTEHVEKENQDRYVYITDDQVVQMVVENLRCDPAVCYTVYDNAMRYLSGQANENGGEFHSADAFEFHVGWRGGLGDKAMFVFRMASSLTMWTYSTRLDRQLGFEERFENIKAMANRQRYEEALRDGNVAMGRWGPQVYAHARNLLKDGRKGDGLGVLKNLLVTSPLAFEAHLDFAENTPDRAAAAASAAVVLENAESPALLERAVGLLGRARPTLESLPVLERAEAMLQLILVPLPPCDVGLVEEAAAIYRKITDIPVKVVRIAEAWRFAEPNRIPDQKRIQQAIVERRGSRVDFSGWTLERYVAELVRAYEQGDALSRYVFKMYAAKLGQRPGQYDVDPYLHQFIDILARYRSGDVRTMYVGVTEANIYGGDTNFLYSAFTAHGKEGASILSYAMMMARAFGEPNESRKRVAERLAKEMVPASLKALQIPRPTDPADPYSYADGPVRLDQKGLALSAQTREALAKYR